MKEQKSTKKIIYLIIAIIIIIGAIICKAKGFNIELIYSNRQQISISNSTELDTNKIEEISKSILAGRKVKVQELERFGNAVQIISESISDEEKQNLINKINEECGTDISNDDTKIVTVSNTRIRDILKPYILPSIITFVAVLLYFLIMYHKIGVSKVLLKGIFTPIYNNSAKIIPPKTNTGLSSITPRLIMHIKNIKRITATIVIIVVIIHISYFTYKKYSSLIL